jgi:hypothetical protein
MSGVCALLIESLDVTLVVGPFLARHVFLICLQAQAPIGLGNLSVAKRGLGASVFSAVSGAGPGYPLRNLLW